MADKISNYIQDHNSNTLTSPPVDGVVVVPSDLTDGTGDIGYVDAANPGMPCKTIWVGTGGNITVRLKGSTVDLLFPNVPAGWFDVCARRVVQTGTTAVGMVACY